MLHCNLGLRALCLRTAALWLICLPGLALGQSTFTHVHLRAPDAWAAAHWYQHACGRRTRVGGESGMAPLSAERAISLPCSNRADGTSAPTTSAEL